MTKPTFRALSIGDTLKYPGTDPTKIMVTNQYIKVIDGTPVSFATLNDGFIEATVSENDEELEMLFPFDFSLPQPDAGAISYAERSVSGL